MHGTIMEIVIFLFGFMLFYISFPSLPNINTLYAVVDRERLFGFKVDIRARKPGKPCCSL